MPPSVGSIFDKVQNTTVHNKAVQSLLDLKEKADPGEFQKNFLLCVEQTIMNGDNKFAVRILDFVSKFCATLEGRKNKTNEENDFVEQKKNKNDEQEEEEDEEEPMHPFVSYIFKELLKIHSVRSQSGRMRVCYCIKRILQCLGPDASIDSDVCEDIYTAMIERLKDRSPSVRAQAVTALERLQDPSDSECPIVKAFLYHLSKDPSSEVRRAVLLCLGRSKYSLSHIRNRIHDVHYAVRKQAFLSLSKVTIRSHSIRNRELLLDQGLNDQNDVVRDTVEKVLLPSWFENCQGNFIEFLHALDVENSEISEKALKVLLRQKSKEKLIDVLELNSEKLIPPEKLTVELSFYWRCLAEFLQSEEDGLWELVLPELSLFCEYVRKNLDRLKEMNEPEKIEAWDHTQNDFIVLQLLHLMKVFDLGDEAGRENLKRLLIDMLLNCDVRLKLIPTIIDILVKVVPDVDERLSLIAETISEIHDPLVDEEEQSKLTDSDKQELEYKQAQLRVQKNIMEDDLELAIKEKKFLVAEDLKNSLAKIVEELASISINTRSKSNTAPEKNRKDDPGILSKCLTIVYEMMQSPTVKTLSPQLRSIMDNLVKNSLKIEHAVIQVLALQCLAVFSLLDETIAKDMMVLFCLYLGSTCDEIAQVAVKGILDQLLKYGLQTFAIREDDGDIQDDNSSPRKKLKKNLMRQSTFINDDGETDDDKSDEEASTKENEENDAEAKEYHLLSLLTKYLDSAEGQMLFFITEGLCKLLLAMRISSPKLVSRLLLLWFNPVHEDDNNLRQILGLFFKMYATTCPISQETLEQCFIPTIKTVLEAPVSSPLSQVDVDSVAKFILDLTKSGVNRFSQVNVHNNLALHVCNEILKDNFEASKHEWINFLSLMNLVLDEDMKRDLQKLVDKMKKECPDRSSIRAIQKFQNILSSGRRASETSTGDVTVTENIDPKTGSRVSGKRGSASCLSISTIAEETGGSNRNKALRTETNSITPSSSDSKRIIPETSESDESDLE